MSLWSDRARAAFESNVFAPDGDAEDAMEIDVETVIDEYKNMKTFLQNNQRQFPQLEVEINGEIVGPRHPAFKLALLTRMCNYHFGEVRQFGGGWRLAYGSYNPADLPTWNFTPCIYKEEDMRK